MSKYGMKFADTFQQKLRREGICMKGTIGRNKSGKGAPYYVKFGNIYRRFWDEAEANRFLTGLRWEVDRGSFDARDHAADQPLGVANLIEEYIEIRRPDLKAWRIMRTRLEKAAEYFGNTNIKEIGYPELAKFFRSLPVGNATKDVVRSTVRTFWGWVQDEHDVPIPKFPTFKFQYKRKKVPVQAEENRQQGRPAADRSSGRERRAPSSGASYSVSQHVFQYSARRALERVRGRL
jgi:hypothetical protein